MPELPEVETIRLGLQQYLVGHKIIGIDVRLPRIFSGEIKKIIGAKVIAVRRLGKGLLIDLDNGYSIAVHVKMTGQLLYRRVSRVSSVPRVPRAKVNVDELPDKYTHIILSLDNNATLFYRDMRQFGWIKILSAQDAQDLPFFKSLGPEPLKDLTLEKFKAIILSNKTNIKVLLMDQKKISGIGNIYANDALFIAGIDPRRYSASLSQEEQLKLFKAVEQVLNKGIKAGGASERDYVDALGGKGNYQNFFQVYNKRGKQCKNCGAIIEKISLGGRGTFFCPACQR
jgi:formamidopyrimidine-DNA glycosylase